MGEIKFLTSYSDSALNSASNDVCNYRTHHFNGSTNKKKKKTIVNVHAKKLELSQRLKTDTIVFRIFDYILIML